MRPLVAQARHRSVRFDHTQYDRFVTAHNHQAGGLCYVLYENMTEHNYKHLKYKNIVHD